MQADFKKNIDDVLVPLIAASKDPSRAVAIYGRAGALQTQLAFRDAANDPSAGPVQ